MPIRLSDIPEEPTIEKRKTIRLSDIPETKAIRLSDIPELPEEKSKILQVAKTALKTGWKGTKGILSKGLGVVGWPFERMEYGVATPLYGLKKLEEAISVGQPMKGLKEGYPYFKTGVKSLALVPKLHPESEEVKTFNDVWGSYYESITGEKAPEWYKNIGGVSTSFLVTPAVLSTGLNLIASNVSRIPAIQKTINARRLMKWEVAKGRAKIGLASREEVAKEIGKSLAGKEVNRLAKDLSIKAGKPISPEAVKLRLGQIIKGSITEDARIKQITNPAIAEIEKVSQELKALGLLPEETYITKLPRRRIAQLFQEKAKLQKQLAKVQRAKIPVAEPTVPEAIKAKIGLTQQKIKGIESEMNLLRARLPKEVRHLSADELAEMAPRLRPSFRARVKRLINLDKQLEDLAETSLEQKYIPALRFRGRAKQIRQLQEKIEGITDRIKTSYELGGTKYMARMYMSKEEVRLARKFPFYAPKRIRAQYAKMREKIPFEVRAKMGEIREPGYPVVKRLFQEASDIENAKLFEFAEAHPSWWGDIWRQGLAKKPLPDTKAYGVLRGKFVHPLIHDDITQMMHIRNNYEAIYDSVIGSWKLGKVVLNPATHFRNMFSNSILLDLSGMSHGQQTKYFLRALREIKNNSEEYQRVKGVLGRSGMIRGEMLDKLAKSARTAEGTGLQNFFNKIKNIIRFPVRKSSEVYQAEEFVSKFMKYLQQRDLGKAPMAAIREANKWLFDYGELAGWEKSIMRRLMPFYTFPRKAIPRVMEAAATRPYTLAKYPFLAWGLEKYSLYKLNITEKDYAELKKVLPEYMKQGSYILMPYRDKNGDLRFLDWTYLVPWGELYDANQRGLIGAGITNPLLQLWADTSRNKSGWTGQTIWNEMDTAEEKNYKKMLYVWQAAWPSLMYKGIYWDKLYEAVTGKPSKYGKARLIPETIAHTLFGVRMQAIDPELQKRWHILGLNEKTREIWGKLSDIAIRRNAGNITEEEFEKRKNDYIELLKKTLKEGAF